MGIGRTWLVLFFSFLSTACTICVHANSLRVNANNEIIIVIPGPTNGKEIRNPFVEELIHLIFAKQNKSLKLQYELRNFSQGRALKELAQGNLFDLNWSVTSFKREQDLLPIKIPIYQGFIGLRVFLIKRGDEDRFNQVFDVEQLKSFIAVQRFDWTDYDVLKENGLAVEGNLSFENLSLAITDGIADYFPRSVLEVTRESSEKRNKGLMIEPNLLLKYPSANYFFVHKNNVELANIIQLGFDKMLQDGSYMALFQKHFGESLKQVNIEKRRVIKLKNSRFPEQSDSKPIFE